MSFSFRNIFSDDSEFESESESDPGSANVFSADESAAPGRVALSASSPEPGARQTFLASELLPYIPKAIAAPSGIPMEKEVHVPVPADGSLDVRLSTLYQLCPELFAAEITPLNDSEVTLPPRLGAIPFSSAAKSAVGGAAAGDAAVNPFWSPVSSGKPEASPQPAAHSSPSSTMPSKSPKEPSTGANPFSAEPMSKTNPFSDTFSDFGKMGGDAGAGAFGSGFSKPGEPAAASPESKADDSGFPAAAFTGNPFESSGSFSTLFSKTAKEDEAIPFPAPATEAQSSAAASESEGVWGALFSGTALSEEEETEAGRPEADKADHAGFESIGNLLKQGAPPAAPETAARPEAIEPKADPFVSPFDHAGAFAAGFSAFSPASAEGPKKGGEFCAAEEIVLPAMPTAPEAKTAEPTPTDISAPTEPMNTSFTVPVAEPRPVASPVAEATPFAMPAGFGEPTAKTETPAEPVKETVAESAPASAWPTTPEPEAVPASAVEAAAPSAPAADDDLRDLELRAIFSTSESFTLSKVARKVVALSGINSCSLSTPVKLVQASRREENRLGDESREMVSTLRSLAKLTGMTEARTFTLQTDRGIVSLFLEGECCVTVHHDAAAFGPGVREKLILVARSIGKLRE